MGQEPDQLATPEPDPQVGQEIRIPAISVVIPTYGEKGVALTKRCLDSLRETHGHLNLEKVVVSDGPEGTEALAEICREHQAELYVIERGGFAKACNHGLKRTSGFWTFLVNNDIEFIEPCLQIMRACGDAFQASVVGCRLLYPDRTIQHAGVIFVPTPNGRLPGYWDHALRGQHALHPMAVTFANVLVTGALFGINHWARQTLGFLDERLPFSCEDIAYGVQAVQAGMAPLYCGVTAAIHHEGATRGRTPEEKQALAPDIAAKEQESLRRFFAQFPAVDWTIFAS